MSWRPRDPLAIDLDGDGIETVGIGSTPILFDHNADGIKTGTGWVKADDAWLVLDRDANGSIDSGRELFGVDTQITVNGVTRNATSGFEALGTLDANADGSFTAADAQFGNVRLWRDLNQDGVSQSSELLTLAQAGISAIGLTPSGGTVNLGNGNSITGQAVVTRSNGSTTAVGSVSVGGDTNAGNLNLADNPFYREFTDPVPLTEAAEDLPEMGGSGWVRDLREAMSLGTPEAAALAATVSAFATASTRDAQMALLDQLLLDWAKTNQTQPTTNAWFTNATPAGGMIDPTVGVTAQLSQAVPVLEVFNGQAIQGSGTLYSTTTATSTVNGQSGQAIVLNGAVAGLMLQAYAALRDSVYAALVVQTRLQPYLDSIELVIDEDGIHFDTTALSDMLVTAQTADAANAIYDLVDLNRYASDTLQAVGFDVLGTLRTRVDALPSESPLWATLANAGVLTGTSASGTDGRDIFLGDAGNSSFNGGAGDDLADGGAGNDSLSGGAGNDVLYGGDGADTLNGEAGNDTLDGGAGNDWLAGATGNNVYQFGRGDGQDTIAYYSDATAGKLNTVQFKAGVAPSDVVLKQVYDSGMGGSAGALEVSIAGTTDKITVQGYFYGNNPGNSYNPVQQFSFADGTVWDTAAIVAQVFAGTAGADTIVGTVNADTIGGQAGNDGLSGGAGNDVLSGGDGADTLNGEAGNDTLDGGAGNDWLAGATGNNVYQFGRGDGQDTIAYYSDATAGKLNTVQFKAGVAPSDVVLKQVYDSGMGGSAGALEVSIVGTTDKITVQGYFYGNNPGSAYNPVQQFVFADGTTWDTAAIVAQLFAGTSTADTIVGTVNADTISGQGGNDSLSGNAGNDVLSGGDGADTLNGEAGNDTLDGGAGNDWLAGATGNNIYQFGRGDGQDTVAYFSDATAGKLNTVQLKAGVAPSDVVLKQVYDSGMGGSTGALEVSIAGTTDKITIQGYFYGNNPGNSYNPVQQFSFADGTVWDIAAINAAVFAGTAGADTLIGTINADVLSGQNGNDSLAGNGGNDTLNGGAGNDTLIGGSGNDTFIVGRGFGVDLMQDNDATAGNSDVLQFMADVASDQVWLRKVGNDLEVSIIGTADKAMVQNWYSGSAYHVEQFKTSDGKTLLDSQVQGLVDAMAGFAPPAMGQTTLPESYQASLAPTIASSWGS